MYIEKLREEDVRAFLEANIKMEIEQIEMLEDQIYVRLGFDDKNVVEFSFRDFDIEGHNIFAKAGKDIVEEKWIDFMKDKFDYKLNMFGHRKNTREYTTARLEHLRAKNSGIER